MSNRAKNRGKKKKTLLNASQIDERLRKGEGITIGQLATEGNTVAERVISTYVNWQRLRDEQSAKMFELAYSRYTKYKDSAKQTIVVNA